MIDMAGALTTYLRGNAPLMTLAGNHVYCDEVAEGTNPPYVLLRTVNVVAAAAPSTDWDTYVIQVDCTAPVGQYAACMDIANTVRNLLHAARSTVQGSARVTSVVVSTSQVGVDEASSPAIPRWVLTVDVTGRSN